MPGRRTFLSAAAFAALRPAVAAPVAHVESIDTVSHQPDNYHGWATLARRRNGELLLVSSAGREAHVCPFGRVELMRSTGEGRNWSWPQVLMDSPIDDRDAGICETAAGSLLVTTFTSLAWEAVSRDGWPAGRLARWEAAKRLAAPEQRKALLGTWMLRSTDGGMTWSAPYRVPLNSPHGPVAVSGGRVLYAGKRLWDEDRRNGLCESRDDGQTWRWLADIPTRPGDRAEDYHELHAIEAAPGRIVVHVRNHNPANRGETLQCDSSDGGKTLSVPRAIGVWGLPSHLLRLADGRLLMSYSYRRPPFGNQARISEDGGRTWSGPLTVSGDGASGDLGYPSTVELPDGRLLTAWYELPKGGCSAVLRLARWSIPG